MSVVPIRCWIQNPLDMRVSRMREPCCYCCNYVYTRTSHTSFAHPSSSYCFSLVTLLFIHATSGLSKCACIPSHHILHHSNIPEHIPNSRQHIQHTLHLTTITIPPPQLLSTSQSTCPRHATPSSKRTSGLVPQTPLTLEATYTRPPRSGRPLRLRAISSSKLCKHRS